MNDAKPDKTSATNSELGKETQYDTSYNPSRLYPILRAPKRLEIGIDPDVLPFFGFDCWNHYEVSWLNAKGKPCVAVAEIYYDCNTLFIIESKSLKLYFNSLNNVQFESKNTVEKIIQTDLEKAIGAPVTVIINQLGYSQQAVIQDAFTGECIDVIDVACTKYTVEPNYLTISLCMRLYILIY